MKGVTVLAMFLLVSGCVTTKTKDNSTTSSEKFREPSQIVNAPITIAWDMRNTNSGYLETYLTYSAPSSSVGKTLRFAFSVTARSARGQTEVWSFLPEDTLKINDNKGSVLLDNIIAAIIMSVRNRENAVGLATFRVALYETSDAIGGREKYGENIAVYVPSISGKESTALLGYRAAEVYQDQVSNMLEIQRQLPN